MRNPQFGQFLMDDDPADHKAPFRLKPPPGWDLRDEPPEEEPVIVYRLSPEEIAARYGPPNKAEVKTVGEDKQEQPVEKWPVSPERLRELFIDQGLDRAQIAARYGVSKRAVASALGRYGIRRKAGRPSPFGDGKPQAAPTRVTAQLNEARTHLAAVQVTGVMQAPCACRVLDSIAKLIETNPLMARVSVEIQVRAAGE